MNTPHWANLLRRLLELGLDDSPAVCTRAAWDSVQALASANSDDPELWLSFDDPANAAPGFFKRVVPNALPAVGAGGATFLNQQLAGFEKLEVSDLVEEDEVQSGDIFAKAIVLLGAFGSETGRRTVDSTFVSVMEMVRKAEANAVGAVAAITDLSDPEEVYRRAKDGLRGVILKDDQSPSIWWPINMGSSKLREFVAQAAALVFEGEEMQKKAFRGLLPNLLSSAEGQEIALLVGFPKSRQVFEIYAELIESQLPGRKVWRMSTFRELIELLLTTAPKQLPGAGTGAERLISWKSEQNKSHDY